MAGSFCRTHVHFGKGARNCVEFGCCSKPLVGATVSFRPASGWSGVQECFGGKKDSWRDTNQLLMINHPLVVYPHHVFSFLQNFILTSIVSTCFKNLTSLSHMLYWGFSILGPECLFFLARWLFNHVFFISLLINDVFWLESLFLPLKPGGLDVKHLLSPVLHIKGRLFYALLSLSFRVLQLPLQFHLCSWPLTLFNLHCHRIWPSPFGKINCALRKLCW